MQKLNKEACTGCGACYNICPMEAITIKEDEYGFYKPVIDEHKCTNCGLCEKTCPLDNYDSKNNPPKAFSLINKDENIRLKSASGGAFSAFAKYILEQNGVVYGVIYDENMQVIHSRATTFQEVEKMYSSKYVQSNTRDTFKQAKKDLEDGKYVLFSGTPCQIAGLKSYLRKTYDNLITVDLICHGVPSTTIFEKYKKEFMQNKPNEKLININFRSKIKGWETYTIENTTNRKSYYINRFNDLFMKAFIADIAINNSCLKCEFSAIPRIADITIGDFWGVDDYDKTLNDQKGLSIILVNSKKGQDFLKLADNHIKIIEVPLEVAIKGNPNIHSSSKAHKSRAEFLEELCVQNKPLKYCVKKYIKTPVHITLYRLLPKFVKDFIKYKILKIGK